MSLLEALTMTSGLVYLVLLLWQGRSGWGWTLSLLLAAALWLLVADSVLWLALGLVATTLAIWLRYHPLLMLAHIDSQRLRTATRQLLLLCWGLVAVQYVVHIGQLGQGMSPWLVRPDVVDGFLPIAGGLGLRAWLGQGLTDPITRRPPSPCWCSPCRPCCWVGRFVPGSARSGWWGSGCTACARACCRGVDPAALARCRVARPEVSGARLSALHHIAGGTRRRPARLPCQPLPSGGGHEDGGLLLQPDPDLGPVPWLGAAAHRHLPARVLPLPLPLWRLVRPARPADPIAHSPRPGPLPAKCGPRL